MNNRSFRFSEFQFRSYQELGISAQDPVLEAVEHLNRSAGCEILRLERKGIRAQDRVGLVRVGSLTIEVLPKIDPLEDGQVSKYSAERNLLVMLSYAYAFPIQLPSEANVSAAPGDWFELLTHIFTSQLHTQLLGGLAHHYEARDESLPVLRGRWDLTRQMRRPIHERHLFEVSYEELTADTPLNQVFCWVVDRLADQSIDRANLALLAGLRDWLQSVSALADISPALLESVTFDRNNERFHPAFNLARLFVEGNIIQLRSGELPAYAFVFEMNRLFERFIAGFLERYREPILPDAWQGAQLVVQSAGKRAYLAQCEGRGVLRLIPDLLIQPKDGTAAILVADTKYRILEGRNRDEIAREDAYQMLAYLVRLGCRRGLLIYPQPSGGKVIRRRWVMETPGLEIFASTVNLHARLDRPEPLISELSEILSMAAGKSLPASL